MKIVTLTLNPALDKSTTTLRLVPEQKLRCPSVRLDAGGGGINVSKAIHKLGGASTAVFPAGGANGRILCDLLQEAGVDTQHVDIEGETRENFSVTETTSNIQYRFVMAGGSVSMADAERCLARVEALKPAYLVASGSLPPGLPETFFEVVAAFSKRIGARFVLDTSGTPLYSAADEGLFMLKPNLTELSALAGVPELQLNQVDDAALDIIRRGKCEIVVVSLGPQGALLVTREGFEHIPAPHIEKKSTVGAGDSMVGGMVWALAQGKTPREMARLGVACGSAATMNAGSELFHAEDAHRLKKWLDTYGERYRIKNFE